MKIQQLFFLILTTFSLTFAHRVILMVEDNDDGTIYVEAGLSTGRTAEGAKVVLTEKSTGRPLWQGIMPDSNKISVTQPTVPYDVTLTMSEGHSITKSGPLPAISKESVTKVEEKPQESELKEVKESSKKSIENDTTKVEIEKESRGLPRAIITIIAMVVATSIGFYTSFKKRA